ncbi:hypothetical protein ABBQ38_009541 [Trebouxia sp. C0009 RCD-2024]
MRKQQARFITVTATAVYREAADAMTCWSCGAISLYLHRWPGNKLRPNSSGCWTEVVTLHIPLLFLKLMYKGYMLLLLARVQLACIFTKYLCRHDAARSFEDFLLIWVDAHSDCNASGGWRGACMGFDAVIWIQ